VPAAGAATWVHRHPAVQGGEKQSQTGVRHDFRCLVLSLFTLQIPCERDDEVLRLRRKRRGGSLWPWTTRHIRTARGCGWLRTSYATKTKSSCSTASPPTYVHTDGVLTRTHNRQLSHPCHGVESRGTYRETLLQTLSGEGLSDSVGGSASHTPSPGGGGHGREPRFSVYSKKPSDVMQYLAGEGFEAWGRVVPRA
jgi:hypothetical protein